MIISAQFEKSIKNIFLNCDKDSLVDGKGPFTTNVRSLLVQSILNNLNFRKVKIKEKSLSVIEETLNLNDYLSRADTNISQRGIKKIHTIKI